MPIASEGYPLAAAASPRVQVVETTDSTNADVIRHVVDAPEEWPHLALLLFQVVESAGIACLVGAGDTRTGLFVMIGVALANVPLAWGFAFGWGPLPALGFVGIALGTGLSHALGCLAVMTVLCRGRFDLKIDWRRLRPRFDLIARLLRVSVPAAADSLSTVLGHGRDELARTYVSLATHHRVGSLDLSALFRGGR